MRTTTFIALALASVTVGTGCTGQFDFGPNRVNCEGAVCREPDPTELPPVGSDCAGSSCWPLPTADGTPTTSSALPRLARGEWERSALDLLALDGTCAPPPIPGAEPNRDGITTLPDRATIDTSAALEITVASETLAECATLPGNIARFVTPELRADASGGALIQSLGARAHRRPLTSDELTEYRALFAEGASLYTGLAAFDAGVRVFLEALLQSPLFVYRVEVGAAPTLDARELAARLSLGLWGRAPDDALAQAAASGALDTPAGVASELDRLESDPRFRGTVERFHAWLLFENRWAEMPTYDSAIVDDAREETRRYVDDIVFGERAGFSRLLTATHTFANARLAERYGLMGSLTDTDFTRVDLQATGRAGILTHVGFLISTADGHPHTAPIHRGVRVGRRWLCEEFGAMANAPTMDDQSSTRRRSVEARTSSCGGNCHVPIINPLGMAFEGFDDLGRVRTLDDTFGHAASIDTRVVFDFDAHPQLDSPAADPVAMNGAGELSTAIATARRAHDCYARNWIGYLLARQPTEGDVLWARRIGLESFAHDLPIVDLVRAIATSPEFRARP